MRWSKTRFRLTRVGNWKALFTLHFALGACRLSSGRRGVRITEGQSDFFTVAMFSCGNHIGSRRPPRHFLAVTPKPDMCSKKSQPATESPVSNLLHPPRNPGASHSGSYQDRHLSTDHLLNNLKGRAISSSVVTVVAQVAQFVLTLGSTMILARLLAPQDFGLLAMVTTIMGFLRVFNDAGLSTATVQREGITHAQVSNLFWTNIALGGSVTFILAVSAPVIAWFYREPRLVGITLAVCTSFLFATSTVQHMALLKRQMHFRLIALVQLGSVAAGVAVGIVTRVARMRLLVTRRHASIHPDGRVGGDLVGLPLAPAVSQTSQRNTLLNSTSVLISAQAVFYGRLLEGRTAC